MWRENASGSDAIRLPRELPWRTNRAVLYLLLQPTEYRIESDAGRNRDEDSRGKLNLIGCRDSLCLWRKHTRRADPLRDEVGEADDKSGQAAEQERRPRIALRWSPDLASRLSASSSATCVCAALRFRSFRWHHREGARAAPAGCRCRRCQHRPCAAIRRMNGCAAEPRIRRRELRAASRRHRTARALETCRGALRSLRQYGCDRCRSRRRRRRR